MLALEDNPRPGGPFTYYLSRIAPPRWSVYVLFSNTPTARTHRQVSRDRQPLGAGEAASDCRERCLRPCNGSESSHRPSGRLTCSHDRVGDAPQEGLERLEFLGSEGVVHSLELAFPAAQELCLHFPPPGRQKDTAGPPVLGVRLAADELLPFQPRQHLAYGVGVGESPFHQFALGDALLLGQQGQP